MNNKSIPKFKKVNYVEIYKRVNNKELIRNNIPLIHINLSKSIKHKSKNESENESKENIISNQTLKSPKELNISLSLSLSVSLLLSFFSFVVL